MKINWSKLIKTIIDLAMIGCIFYTLQNIQGNTELQIRIIGLVTMFNIGQGIGKDEYDPKKEVEIKIEAEEKEEEEDAGSTKKVERKKRSK